MARPNISEAEILGYCPEIQAIEPQIPRGGQKAVFPFNLGNQRFVLMALECCADEDMDDGTLARVEREVAILGTCDTPHLPKLGPIGLRTVERGGKSLVMFSEEFVEGPTLEAMLIAGSLPIAEATQLARHMAHAIDALWQNRKIHRDIKPSNIIRRSADGAYVLLDPGIAYDQTDNSLTGDGIVPHTPGFLAPEHVNAARKRETDHRADFFLLGIVLYMALTQKHPFWTRPNLSRQAIVQNILALNPPPPLSLRNDVPPRLSAIVMRLLEKKTHLRFKDCGYLIEALEGIDGGQC